MCPAGGYLAAAPSLSPAISQPIWEACRSLVDAMVIRRCLCGRSRAYGVRFVPGAAPGARLSRASDRYGCSMQRLVASTTPKAHLDALGIMQVAIFGNVHRPLDRRDIVDTLGSGLPYVAHSLLLGPL